MDVTMTAIGTARTPFGATGEIPKGPDAKHDAEGVIELDRGSRPGSRTSRAFRTSTSSGSSTASTATTSSPTRRPTTGRTASSRLALLGVRVRSD